MRVIYCAGEQGRVVLDILRSTGNTENVVFADDDASLHGKSVRGTEVVGDLRTIAKTTSGEVQYIVAFGDRQGIRVRIAEKITETGSEFFNAIHPSATVSDTVSLGENVTINGQSYVGTDVTIRDHVLIDSCANISHDVVLKPGVTVTPSVTLAGGVVIGPDAYIGPNATVVENVTIGKEAVVGAGSVVMDNVPAGTTVVGSPAQPISSD